MTADNATAAEESLDALADAALAASRLPVAISARLTSAPLRSYRLSTLTKGLRSRRRQLR
jgi:hypothetical protein